MYHVYVIQSEVDGRLYKGMTDNLERRILEHNKGEQKSTKFYKPWKLMFTKVFKTRAEARKYEKYLKSGIGRAYLKSILEKTDS
jgi:putative endonuclease